MSRGITVKKRKTKRARSLCSILLCIAMMLTQAAPVSFADDGDGTQAENQTEAVQNIDEAGAAAAGTESDGESDVVSDDENIVSEETDDEAGEESAAREQNDGGTDESGGAAGEADETVDLLEEESGTATEPESDISWYNDESTTKAVTLSDAADLRGLAELVNGTAKDSDGNTVSAENFSGWTITLGADVDLGGTPADTTTAAVEWTPIGASGKQFRGTFDGDGHSVTGMKISTDSSTAACYMGFFGSLNSAAVYDLKISGEINTTTTDTEKRYVGGLAGYVTNTSINNVYTDVDISSEVGSGSTSTSNSFVYAGGIAGYVDSTGTTIINCVNSGSVSATGRQPHAGGIAGYAASTCTIANSINAGKVSAVSNNTKSGSVYAGGIADYGSSKLTVENCVNSGEVSGTGRSDSYTYAASIVAYGGTSTIKNCYVTSASTLSVYKGKISTSSAGLGTFGTDWKVTAAEGYTLSYENETDLKKLLNLWVCENSTTDVSYRLWKTDSTVGYIPAGTEIKGASAPTVSATAGKTASTFGSDGAVTLTAKIEAASVENAALKIKYQWYVSDYSEKTDPEKLTADDASGESETNSIEVACSISSEEFSDKYYYVVAESIYTYTVDNEVAGTQTTEAESDAVNVIFLNSLDGYTGEIAENFAGGSGTEDDPYLIETPAQLKLMSSEISSGTGKKDENYKLAADIDFNNMRWIPAGENSSGYNVFAGTFDGNGYSISNLRILSDSSKNNYVGFFAYISKGTVKNVTISGTMNAKSKTYAGGVTGRFAGSKILNVVSDIDITVDGCTYTGGIAGHCYGTLANCAFTGKITCSNPKTITGSGTGGLVGYHSYDSSGYSIKNCYVSGTLTGDFYADRTGIISGCSSSKTGPTLENCYTTKANSEGGIALFNDYGDSKVSGIGIIAEDGTVSAADGYTLAYEDSNTLSLLLNKWVAENADEDGSYNMWVKDENGVLKPTGKALKNAPMTLTAEVATENPAVGSDVTLSAVIKSEDDDNTNVTISYQWYVSEYASGAQAEAAAGTGASGTLSGDQIQAENTVIYTLNESEYTDKYYIIKVTKTKSFYDETVLLGTVESAAEECINVIIKDANSTAYQGDTAEAFAGGSGTEADPYLIKTPAQLKLMGENISAGTLDKYYELANDIDFNNMRWTPAGPDSIILTTMFKGGFDGGGYTISNLNIISDGSYAGFIKGLNGASIHDVTLTGSVKASGPSYVGSVTGRTYGSSVIKNVVSKMTISVENNTSLAYIGGIAGHLQSGTVEHCANYGSISINSPKGYYKAGGITGAAATSSNSAEIVDSYNTGNITCADGGAETSSITGTPYIGGIAGEIISGSNGDSSMLNSANYGSITADCDAFMGAPYINGIAYASGGSKTYVTTVKNCVSGGTVKDVNSDSSDRVHTGLYLDGSNITCSDCYALKNDSDSTEAFYYTESENITSLGTYDTTGSLTAADDFSLNYFRSDEVKTAMGGTYTDLYCALVNWAGEQNASDTANSYRSWVKYGETDYLVPDGDSEKSSLGSLEVTVSDKGFSGETFEYGTTDLGTMSAVVSGISDVTPTYIYSWYLSRFESGENAEKLQNTSEDPSQYTPDSKISGSLYYFAGVTAVSDCWFKTAESNKVSIQIASNTGVWEGLVADVSELEGCGTETEPYLIKNGEQLALVLELISDKPTETNEPADTGEDDSGDTDDDTDSGTDTEKTYAQFRSAYYEITNDIVMDGVHRITTSSMEQSSSKCFAGHISGRQQEDGSYPVISNVVINSEDSGSSTYCGIFGYVTGAEFKNFSLENVSITSSAARTGAVAAYAYNTSFSNITVSGNITSTGTGSSSTGGCSTGGIAGCLEGINDVSIKGCVNSAIIKYSGSSGEGMGSSSSIKSAVGGIVGKITGSSNKKYPNELSVINCENKGSIESTGYAGGIAGYAGMGSGIGYSTYVIDGCINRGTVTSAGSTGGILGYVDDGLSKLYKVEIRNSYNRGGLATTSTGSNDNNVYAGGIVGYIKYAYYATVTGCYSTGSISHVADANTDYLREGAIAAKWDLSNVSDTEKYSTELLQNNYYLSDGKTPAIGYMRYKVNSSYYEYTGTVAGMEAVTADELKSAGAVAVLGDAYAISAGTDSSSDTGTETAETDTSGADTADTSTGGTDTADTNTGGTNTADTSTSGTDTDSTGTADTTAGSTGNDGFPILTWESDDIYTVTIEDDDSDEDSAALLKIGESKTASIHAQSGVSFTAVPVGNGEGFTVLSLSSKSSDGTVTAMTANEDGTYTISVSGRDVALVANLKSDVVFLGYAAAPDGYRLAVYRTTEALGENTAFFYGGDEMLRAPAFDSLTFVNAAAEDGTDTGLVTISEATDDASGDTTDATLYTYVYFVSTETTANQAAAGITRGEGTCPQVDCSDYDITGNGTINIFDAQRVWDMFTYDTYTKATDLTADPDMNARLQADVNQDGDVTVLDVLQIQKYLHTLSSKAA